MASPKWVKNKKTGASVLMQNLDNFCVTCGAEATSWSALDMAWCEEHAHRGKLADWANINGFPSLDFHPYKIAADEATWRVVIGTGKDEGIWLALAAIECLEAQEAS